MPVQGSCTVFWWPFKFKQGLCNMLKYHKEDLEDVLLILHNNIVWYYSSVKICSRSPSYWNAWEVSLVFRISFSEKIDRLFCIFSPDNKRDNFMISNKKHCDHTDRRCQAATTDVELCDMKPTDRMSLGTVDAMLRSPSIDLWSVTFKSVTILSEIFLQYKLEKDYVA